MPGTRPYDANQLNNLIAAMEGTAPPAPDRPELTVVDEPGFEYLPKNVSPMKVAVRGLFKLFSSEGREELRDYRDDVLEKRALVSEAVGERIMNPGSDTDVMKASGSKISWRGYNKFVFPINRRREEFSNMGLQLMDDKRAELEKSRPENLIVNIYRPTTRAERHIRRRLENQFEKQKRSYGESKWSDRSDAEILRRSSDIPLTRKERKNLRHTSHYIAKHVAKMNHARDRMKEIVDEGRWPHVIRQAARSNKEYMERHRHDPIVRVRGDMITASPHRLASDVRKTDRLERESRRLGDEIRQLRAQEAAATDDTVRAEIQDKITDAQNRRIQMLHDATEQRETQADIRDYRSILRKVRPLSGGERARMDRTARKKYGKRARKYGTRSADEEAHLTEVTQRLRNNGKVKSVDVTGLM